MHDTAVTIHDGYHVIDTGAWVRQRTRGPLPKQTDALRAFTSHPVFTQDHPGMDTAARMQLWAAARGWTSSEETSYHHNQTYLSEPVSVVLAVGAGQQAYALVQVGRDQPAVYADVTTDDGSWGQVEPVDIVCAAGHRWTWLDFLSVLDDTGRYRPFVEVFGHGWGAPYAVCRDCLAEDDGTRDQPCPCENRYTIYCPTCDQRCRLTLTAVPTFPAPDAR